jgi:hypothetical protein
MAVIRTRYEDPMYGNIKFDVSKFDYTRTDDDFPADVTEDVDNILREVGRVYKIIHQDDTKDGRGRIKAVDEDDFFWAFASLQDLTYKDRAVHGMGTAVSGVKKGFFKKYYTITSAGVDTNNFIKTGDLLVDEYGEKWRISEISGERGFATEKSLVVALLNNTSNQGTTS